MRPLLPRADALLPFLRRIDESRRYTNFGALQVQFETELGEHFGVSREQVVTATNGTIGLTQALRALNARPGAFCVVPAWTFVATVAAVVAAGLTPYLVDVSPHDWAISAETVRAVATGRDVGAVIPVAPFGAPIDLSAWSRFHEDTGIPVVIDAAASFDTVAQRAEPLGGNPIMISLHATKVFGVGEGAVILAPDAGTAHALRLFGNFGFSGSRDAQVPASNGKLSEYVAAVGLAGLQVWTETRQEWAALSGQFAAMVGGIDRVRLAPGFRDASWVGCYGLVELPEGRDTDEVGASLLKRGIETRSWWGRGCHEQTAYRDVPRDLLPTTDDLSSRVLGLPFWRGLSESDVARIADALATVLRE